MCFTLFTSRGNQCACIDKWRRTVPEEKKSLNEVVIFCFLCAQNVLVALWNYGWTTDVTWTIVTMSWALIVVGPLLFMEGQRALGCHQIYLNLYSDDERRYCGFWSTWGWVINDRIKKYRPPLQCNKPYTNNWISFNSFKCIIWNAWPHSLVL